MKASDMPTLLNLRKPSVSGSLGPPPLMTSSLLNVEPQSQQQQQSENVPQIQVAVQPIVLNSDSVLTNSFAPSRNSSSILKEILNDS